MCTDDLCWFFVEIHTPTERLTAWPKILVNFGTGIENFSFEIAFIVFVRRAFESVNSIRLFFFQIQYFYFLKTAYLVGPFDPGIFLQPISSYNLGIISFASAVLSPKTVNKTKELRINVFLEVMLLVVIQQI